MKLFVAEIGSANMLRFASAEPDRNKVVSALTAIEGRSAIYRLRGAKLFTSAQAATVVAKLEQEIGRIVERPLNRQVLETASLMVERHNLRALDSLQLGSAIVARRSFAASDMRFIASDHELLRAAEAESFNIWNPMQ